MDRTIHGMVYNAMKLFMEINPQLFDECSDHYRENEAAAAQTLQNRLEKWHQVKILADQHRPGRVPENPPLTDRRGNKVNLPVRIDEDSMTQDSQQRLDALRLQDETAGGRDGRRRLAPDGQNQVSLLHQSARECRTYTAGKAFFS